MTKMWAIQAQDNSSCPAAGSKGPYTVPEWLSPRGTASTDAAGARTGTDGSQATLAPSRSGRGDLRVAVPGSPRAHFAVEVRRSLACQLLLHFALLVLTLLAESRTQYTAPLLLPAGLPACSQAA